LALTEVPVSSETSTSCRREYSLDDLNSSFSSWLTLLAVSLPTVGGGLAMAARFSETDLTIAIGKFCFDAEKIRTKLVLMSR
jgi:hypothetical protein